MLITIDCIPFESKRYFVSKGVTGNRILDRIDSSTDAFPSADYFMTNDQETYIDRLNYDYYLYLREIRWLLMGQRTPDDPDFF